MVQPWAALLLPLRQIIVCRIESAGLGCAGDVGAGGADVDAVVGGGCWPARRDPAAVHRHALPGRHQLRRYLTFSLPHLLRNLNERPRPTFSYSGKIKGRKANLFNQATEDFKEFVGKKIPLPPCNQSLV